VVGELSAQYSHESQDGTLLNLEAGADRNIDSSNLNAGAMLYSRFGNIRADLLQSVEGGGGTQYGLSYESGIAMTSNGASLGGRDLQQSALIVTLRGDSPDAAFNVLVDEVVRGRLRPGQRLSLFVPGYRTYKVRLVPAAATAVSYDSATRDVTLYPGNVKLLEWRAESFFTVFAQAISATGIPIADALVQTPKGISETDSNGYFQIDVRRGDPITINGAGGQSCVVKLPDIHVKNDFASAGKVVCS
jgi:outer membrane usher protein FimD/PapC